MFVVNQKNLSSCNEFLFWNHERITYKRKDDKELQKIFQTLYEMNIKIWNIKYNESYTFDKINFYDFDKIDIYQCLKYLQCLKYQLEYEYIKEFSLDMEISRDYLKDIIERIKIYIIDNITAYKNANWS
jgi:hypothetical protein